MSDDDRPTPGVVTAAVSIGTAPLPFLAVYTLLFLGHGLIHPVHPPDITSSQHGEVIAGCVTAVLFAALIVGVIWFLNGRRRWPFAIMQAAVVGTAVWFLSDDTKGGPAISALLAVAALVALVLSFAPAAWRHVGRRTPGAVRSSYRPLGLASGVDDEWDELDDSPVPGFSATG